jgi:hypothetical protein
LHKERLITHKQIEPVEAVNNLAIIIQDNLDNTYQKATHDFLKNEDQGYAALP